MGQSWSYMRKILENENICESLKNRIQYFSTRYRKSHDQNGRVAVLFDGNEILKSCYYDWGSKRAKVIENTVIPNTEKLSYRDYWDKIHLETKNLAGFDRFGFYEAFYFYQNHPINESLISSDPVVRLFAIFDRRVGKRMLMKIAPTIESQPEWLQVFYRLRLEAEGLFSCTV